jgi:hypothetical protein
MGIRSGMNVLGDEEVEEIERSRRTGSELMKKWV